MNFFWLFVILFFSSCEKQETSSPQNHISFNWQKITSRDEGDPSSRYPLYDAKVPSDWIRIDPISEQSIADSRIPLVEFTIKENSNTVKIVVHNFSSESVDKRIPPLSQITRWKNQCNANGPIEIKPESHGGFTGLFLECEGSLDKRSEIIVLAWAMQLAPEYYQRLRQTNNFFSRQESADYTIKVTGPKELLNKHREAIISFANSFELINALPAKS